MLAFGDGFATLVGRRTGGRQWPWNREKTIAGTLAFALCGGVGAVALALWTRPAVSPEPSWLFALIAPAAAALVAALVETIPVRLDDNVSVPSPRRPSSGSPARRRRPRGTAAAPAIIARLPWAIGVNLVVAWAGYRARTVSAAGAIGGALVGLVIYAGGGGAAWLLLFATFLAAAVTSRLGLERKTLLGIEEERGGRRGAGNALANCGVAALAAVAAVSTPHAEGGAPRDWSRRSRPAAATRWRARSARRGADRRSS